MSARPPGPNKWGHDRSAPRAELPAGTYSPFLPSSILTTLDSCKTISTDPRRFKVIDRNPNRQARSDRRERCCLVFQCLVSRTDLETWQVVIVNRVSPDKRRGCSVQEIAAATGLSVRAVERTLAEAHEDGLLLSIDEGKGERRRRCAAIHDSRGRLRHGQRRIRQKDPATGQISYEGTPAVREFTGKAFHRLGTLDQMLAGKHAAQAERAKTKKKAEADRAAVAEAETRQTLQNTARLARLRGAPTPAPAPAPAVDAADRASNWAARLLELETLIRRENPALTAEEVRAVARSRLEATGPPE